MRQSGETEDGKRPSHIIRLIIDMSTDNNTNISETEDGQRPKLVLPMTTITTTSIMIIMTMMMITIVIITITIIVMDGRTIFRVAVSLSVLLNCLFKHSMHNSMNLI